MTLFKRTEGTLDELRSASGEQDLTQGFLTLLGESSPDSLVEGDVS